MAEISLFNLTADRVRELFSYDEHTGILTRIKSRRFDMLGPVSAENEDVYIDGQHYKQSRAIWLWIYGEWPKGLVDHKNRNDNDNRKDNLRDVTHTQNQYNKVSPNPHGYKGVTWRNRIKNPWLSKIRVDGTRINLGSFATAEEAARAYEEACLKYHGEYANLGVK